MAIDTDKFSAHLRKHALKKSSKKCGRYVREALEAGGGNTRGHKNDAKDWGPTLLRMGFRQLDVEDDAQYKPMKGDIVVIQPYEGGNKFGHLAGYDGMNWISDFVQRDFWSGDGYRKHKPPHVFYRP